MVPKDRKQELTVAFIESLSGLIRDVKIKFSTEFSDTIQRGLRVRIQPRGATYFARVQYQGREFRVRIGRIDAWGLAHARTVCGAIVRHVSTGNGPPTDEWIELHRQALLAADARKKGHGDATIPYVPEVMAKQPAATTWTYAEARAAYVDWLKAEEAAKNLAPATIQNYSKVLTCPALLPFDERHVARLEAADLAMAVEGLVTEGKRSQANDVSRNMKRLFRWLAEPAQERRSGVREGIMDRVRAPKLSGVKGRQHFPSLAEAGLILATSRASGVLNPAVAASVHLAVWTGQRRLSIVTAGVDDFESWEEEPGWGLWRCRHRKTPRANQTGKPHVIPLPPACWRVVTAYLTWHRLEYDGSTPWAFPQQRPAKAGRPKVMNHIAGDTLTHTMTTIPGSMSSPHDMRRVISSSVQDIAGIHIALVGHVLDHADDEVGVRKTNGTTRRYTEAEMLGFKRPVMEAWERLLEPAAAAAVLLPREELKAELVRRRAKQRGVKPETERARLKRMNARISAQGGTTRQRVKVGEVKAGEHCQEAEPG
ncbi:hypothetical protein ASF27_17050 [Methylobacterium sp. Leaf102]|nr:hypothetical protein ASF27_17050 [Methylobacterium sp. Leaf102]